MFEFRLKSIVLDAIQWGDGQVVKPEGMPIPDWLRKAIESDPGTSGSVFRYEMELHVWTPTGMRIARRGDWILRSKTGHLNVWQDAEFRVACEPILHQPVVEGVVAPPYKPWDVWEQANRR